MNPFDMHVLTEEVADAVAQALMGIRIEGGGSLYSRLSDAVEFCYTVADDAVFMAGLEDEDDTA